MNQQAATQSEVEQIIKDLINDPNTSTAIQLGVDILEMERGKNGGYPRDLYHPHLDPVRVTNRAQEQALAAKGYARNYVHKHYPKMLYRRSSDPRWTEFGGIESRTIKSETAEKSLISANPGEWADNVVDLAPLAGVPTEDPKLAIARLEGQLAEARAAAAAQSKAEKDELRESRIFKTSKA